jgi:hypothetical protein
MKKTTGKPSGPDLGVKTPEAPSWNQEEDGGVVGFMCQTDWEHELGAAVGGNVVYPSAEDLKKHRKCVKQCGIVKVKVYFAESVQAQDFSMYLKNPEPADD